MANDVPVGSGKERADPDETGELPTSIRAADPAVRSSPPAGTSSRPPPPPRVTSPGLGVPPAPPSAVSLSSTSLSSTSLPQASASAERPKEPDSEESVPIDLEDAEEVIDGESRRVSLAALVSLAPVGRYGKFDLLGRIAYGGMAEIFLAREIQEGRAGRFVVVKRVLPHVAGDRQFVDMFVDEARLVMQLSHPNICHVYSYGKEEGAPFISMEWVNGMPLSRVLRRAKTHGGLAIALLVKIVAQIADALDHAHRAVDQSSNEPLGIVHRDVSPQNIMVAFEGSVKLLDFGIAKAASHSTRTEAGTIKGKFAYMAPEQCLGEPLDARADVFALGVVLLEMLSDGVNPFKKQTEFDTMRALVYENPPPPSKLNPSIPRELDAIVAKAIHKKREERYHSASEFGHALETELGRMGQVVTTARIGERMNELFREEIKAGPRLDTRIQVPPRKDGTSDAELARPSFAPNQTEKIATLSAEDADAKLSLAARAATGAFRSEAPEAAPRRPRAGWALFLAALVVCGAVGAGLAIVLRPADPALGTPSAGNPPSPAVAPRAAPSSQDDSVPARAATATLFVDSTPGGAAVFLRDRGEVGTTPLELALLEAGEWNVRLSLDGYENWEDTVELTAGERRSVFGDLEPIARERRTPRAGGPGGSTVGETPPAEPGRLSLNTRPWSRVYLGSRLLGTTPLGDVEVGSGTVRLRLVDRDGVEHSRTVTVSPGGHAREFFDLSSEEAPE